MVRRTLTGADGKAIEVLGAPGPRTLAAWLLARYYPDSLEAAFAKACDGDGLLMQDVYLVETDRKGNSVVRLQGFSGSEAAEWRGDDSDLRDESIGPPEYLTKHCSLVDFAVLRNDVLWRWPIPKDTEWIPIHPVLRPDHVGPRYAQQLRSKIARGMTVADAFEELRFIDGGLTYTLSMPIEGRLRVACNGEGPMWEGGF